MFLKSLEIKGFKSFADPATLELEPGVSVIVGPNGSGKSNVVDAIGWVLGAQAPSAVRSQKMDDVIFAGTQSRPALGRAEVSLTIDNTDGLLGVEFTEIKLTRTLFRSGDSEYAINGVSCRLLDIQELLSDAGVGRQQHVIVSQGQIDAVLNARPEDRRLIIEEAAGVLKYRKRKEKAERRLASTESNLTRLQDLLREVRRQLRPLERQAEAARKHGAVVAELTALRVYVAGREIDKLRTRRDQVKASRLELTDRDRTLKSEARDLDDTVRRAEAELSQIGGDDLGDELALFESLNERARGKLSLIEERIRGVERERGAFVDQEVIANLEADGERSRLELDEVSTELAALAPELVTLVTDEEDLTDERQAFDDELARQSAQQSLPLGDVTPDAEAGGGTAVVDPDHRRRLVEALSGARLERSGAEASLTEIEGRHREAETEAESWKARADALSMALDESRARAGADRLVDVDGVAGTLLDLVAIDDGWEPAFEAAVGEAITAVVVDDADAARRALEALHSSDVNGAVIALALDRSPRAVPSGGKPLRPHVQSLRLDVGRLLDHLLTGVCVVDDWTAAIALARESPDAVVVTRAGDRFGPAGWRIGAGSAQATAAALDEARSEADRTAEAARRATVELAGARSAAEIARRREIEASRQLGRAFDDTRAHLDARTRELSARRTDAEVRRAGLDERRESLQRRIAEIEAKLVGHAEVREAAGQRLAALDQRALALERLAAFVQGVLDQVTETLGDLRVRRQAQSQAVREVTRRLDGARRKRADVESSMVDVREQLQRTEIEEAELKLKLETAIDTLRRELDIDPAVALEAECPPLDEGTTAKGRVGDLERELRIMGPINPLALQEFEALEERHIFLQEQLDDVRSSRRELNKVIREIDTEIVNVFASAYADVVQNFQFLFETLFPGGEGRLKLTDPDNLLETGIEIEAKPSGKNVKKLSLLSGGERSLTALAYLFAVFRSRPSPFYVMDEVEAALDDVNLHRFLDLVHEFRSDAQLIIVSHQKRTMEAADCLYGVSMKPGGSSKLLSERVSETVPV